MSPSVLERAIAYARNQKEHHRTKAFREEVEEFLRKSGVAFDPKYLN